MAVEKCVRFGVESAYVTSWPRRMLFAADMSKRDVITLLIRHACFIII